MVQGILMLINSHARIRDLCFSSGLNEKLFKKKKKVKF